MTDLLLYGHEDSGHAVKVALALALAGLPHRVARIDIWAPPETRDPAFRALSPLGQVPVLVTDGTAQRQSGAILLGLAERFGTLGGESAAGLARARELLFWEHNRIGLCLPQLIEAAAPAGLRPGYGPSPALLAARPWLEDRYATDAAAFATLLGDDPFFHGPRPGIADCAIWGYAQWIERAGLAATPAIEAWRARMRALPQMRAPADFFSEAGHGTGGTAAP